MFNTIFIDGQLLYNEPMSCHTSLKVGGSADLFAIPANMDDLQKLLTQLEKLSIPWLTVGRGYNLLVRDKGIRGAVISLERFNQIELDRDGVIRVGAGAENLALVRFAQNLGLGGIGFISGIPGTIGGAIRMNAGAYGQSLLQHIKCLTLVRNGKLCTLCHNQLQFAYRYLELMPDDVIVGAEFALLSYNQSVTEEEIRKDIELRRTKHNVGFPSAGSFFKNPEGQASWRLIDAAGMRGTSVGGAQVSLVHSNFLINTGSAKADDFFELSDRVKNAVFATSGVTLEEEVRIVGEI